MPGNEYNRKQRMLGMFAAFRSSVSTIAGGHMRQKYRKTGKSRLQFLFWVFPLLFATALSVFLWTALDHIFQKALPVMDRMLALVAIL